MNDGATSHALVMQEKLARQGYKGRLIPGQKLSSLTTWKVGGECLLYAEAEDREDLEMLFDAASDELPVKVIGGGSNLLVSDFGYPGVVLKLAGIFRECAKKEDLLHAGGAAMLPLVSRMARDLNLEGLEWAEGIPGSIGGAVKLNAGAFGCQVDAVLDSITSFHSGKIKTYLPVMGYRSSSLKEGEVVLTAVFGLPEQSKDKIEGRMREYHGARQANQPIGHSAGSVFKNCGSHKAWKLLDDAGCRGLRFGGAGFSEKHCNFIINYGDANASQIKDLIDEGARRVLESSGFRLELEVELLGFDEEQKRS